MTALRAVLIDNALAAAMTSEGWTVKGPHSQARTKMLMARGVFLAAEALEGRVLRGAAIISDEPTSESKEEWAGFIVTDVVDADADADADAAMAVAKGHSMARQGAVKVAPVMVF